MATWTTYYVEVTLRSGKTIKSPGTSSKEKAVSDLDAVREAQKHGTWVEVEWLSMQGGDIEVANLTSSSVGFY